MGNDNRRSGKGRALRFAVSGALLIGTPLAACGSDSNRDHVNEPAPEEIHVNEPAPEEDTVNEPAPDDTVGDEASGTEDQEPTDEPLPPG